VNNGEVGVAASTCGRLAAKALRGGGFLAA
jgi:hypothetical protein